MISEKSKLALFNSMGEFCDFVDSLSVDLNENGFPKVGLELNFILHEMAYTTSSEFLGEIKLALLSLKEYKDKQLPEGLSKNVNLCLNTIENAFEKANSKS